MNTVSLFGFGNGADEQPARGPRQTFVLYLIGLLLFLAVPLRSHAQLPQLQAPPSWGKVPQGTDACSVEKSCADLAPGMIRDALGASPLEQNIRTLTGILSSFGVAPTAGAQAEAWTESALRRAGADEVRVERIGPSDSIAIVVVEIRGRDLPRDYVLIPAPVLLSRAEQRAAAENAAVLIDAVRVIHQTGSIPRRSIRFVFFMTARKSVGGEMAPMWAYVRKNRANLDHIAAAVSIEAANGPLDGYSLEGRPEMLPAVREALEPLRPVGIRNFSEGVEVEADTIPFWLEGVPTLVATSPATSRAGSPAVSGGDKSRSGDSLRGSAAQDSFDAEKLQQLKRGVAVAAVTAYALADAQARIGLRRSPMEVQSAIASAGIESELKASGVWDKWQARHAQENH